MKCKCVSEIEKEMQDAGYTDAELVNTGFIQVENRLEYTTVSTITYTDGKTKTGKDRIKKISITHSFCPFCGLKIKDEDK